VEHLAEQGFECWFVVEFLLLSVEIEEGSSEFCEGEERLLDEQRLTVYGSGT